MRRQTIGKIGFCWKEYFFLFSFIYPICIGILYLFWSVILLFFLFFLYIHSSNLNANRWRLTDRSTDNSRSRFIQYTSALSILIYLFEFQLVSHAIHEHFNFLNDLIPFFIDWKIIFCLFYLGMYLSVFEARFHQIEFFNFINVQTLISEINFLLDYNLKLFNLLVVFFVPIQWFRFDYFVFINFEYS